MLSAARRPNKAPPGKGYITPPTLAAFVLFHWPSSRQFPSFLINLSIPAAHLCEGLAHVCGFPIQSRDEKGWIGFSKKFRKFLCQ